MSACLVVAGTGTDVGKTVFAAALAAVLDGCYWKPVQAGLAGETDADTVRRLSGLPAERILPEAYRLSLAASPHRAAEHDGIEIDTARLEPPRDMGRPVVVEPAGGLLVPLTRRDLQIDLIARWRAPVILCAPTALGTINHSLLSLEALRARDVPVLGIAFIGEEQADSERTIAAFGGVRRLGRLPWLDPLDASRLRAAFAREFQVADFAAELAS